ncbi:Uncharacterized protein HZ326_16554 [Fusarium oxysporum f. sp. albedinis]|nr:Uncharacterized protein HZ326_16554 [Fusarium oxysporum f. sp. albedinis]
MARSELEWFLLKEMMASSRGALKCYISVRGEHVPAKKTSGCDTNNITMKLDGRRGALWGQGKDICWNLMYAIRARIFHERELIR